MQDGNGVVGVNRDGRVVPRNPDGTFPKGVSGNPGGQSLAASILRPFRRMLAENQNEHGEGEGAVQLARLLTEKLKRGESAADLIKILERTDGAVKTQIEHSQAPPPPPIRIEGATPEQFEEMKRLAGGT